VLLDAAIRLADLLPSLRPEVVYVGTSGGAMVATPDFGGGTYDDSEPLTGSDNALGLVDFSVFPHLERENMPDTSLANIEKWAAGYRCRRTRSTMTPQ
jgi:dipeptidase E